MKRVLLHICCGPCTFYPLQRLREQDMDIIGFFYNPNIHPYQEWLRRLEALETVAASRKLRLIVRQDYPLEEFLRNIAFRENQRCIYCYSTRLEAAARLAKKSKFDGFSTTLLFSKRQKHDLVKSIGEEAARKYKIAFYYEDFRVGWKEGQRMAEEAGIYRQQYCGCIFSEKERFYKKRSEKSTKMVVGSVLFKTG